MKTMIRYEAVTKGAATVEATGLLTCRRAAIRIARSMAARVGGAVVVRHNLAIRDLSARIADQRIVRRFESEVVEFLSDAA